jgi:hypothetical protein
VAGVPSGLRLTKHHDTYNNNNNNKNYSLFGKYEMRKFMEIGAFPD